MNREEEGSEEEDEVGERVFWERVVGEGDEYEKECEDGEETEETEGEETERITEGWGEGDEDVEGGVVSVCVEEVLLMEGLVREWEGGETLTSCESE